MQIDDITAMVGEAEDQIRDLSRAITADEKWRDGRPPNEYTRYLEGLLLERVGQWMAMLAIRDFMRAADKKGETYENK